jgi:alpha-beta hydrolase superfamily lysophospholipase
MGAAVALNVATGESVDGLILAAPFWRIGTPVQQIIFQIVKRLFRRPKLFRRANFDDPRLRDFLGGLLPELNLDDPATQDVIRQIRVPSSFADQVFALGKAAGNAARQVAAPTLIIQGLDDEAVRPAATRQLIQSFPGPIQYIELPTDHDLVGLDSPGFAGFSKSALQFAAAVAGEQGGPGTAG